MVDRQAHILDLLVMASLWSLAVFTLLSAFKCSLCSAAGSRGLQQSSGPGAVYGRPASATTADLKNDPQGRQHLLVSCFLGREAFSCTTIHSNRTLLPWTYQEWHLCTSPCVHACAYCFHVFSATVPSFACSTPRACPIRCT